MHADWTRQQLEEMMDRTLDGWSADKIASHMTRMFRQKFSRSGIIGKMNREFGGVKEFLVNFVRAWPDDEKSETVRKTLEKKYGRLA